MLKVGLTHEIEKIVTDKDTAKHLSSGTVAVFSTPMLVALMEQACLTLVQPYLPEEESTVGIEVKVKHLKSSPVGATIKAVATLKEIDRKKLVFDVKCYDNGVLVGDGEHSRFIINVDKFMGK